LTTPIPKIVLDGHFYSPLVDPADIAPRADRIWPAEAQVLGVDFNEAGHRELLTEAFTRYIGDFDYPQALPEGSDPTRYFVGNSEFGVLDCRALFVLLRHWKPRRLVEVGSGFSTLLIADVNRRWFDGAIDVTAIEPFPRPFLKDGVSGLTRLIESKVQDVDPEVFATLRAGDILFIDSSHVAKTGSDVNHLYFEVLPRLASGVLVHIHDIFLPEDYPKDWVFGGRHWNEQYVLRALLMHSTGFRVRFGSRFAFLRLGEVLRKALRQPDGALWSGGSFWIERL
jgi:hypothetical protein